MFLVLALSLQTGSGPAVDVNGPHLVLRDAAIRDWNDLTVELNNSWSFKVAVVPKGPSVCLNLTAFTVKSSLRGDRNFDGMHFDPTTMNVKSVSVLIANKPVALRSVTSGMVKPLTAQEAMMCIGR